MLTHIVCWRYKDEVSEEQREDHRAALRGLVGQISEIIDFRVGKDMMHLDRSFDTGLYSTFADETALQKYSEHPAHLAVAAMGREMSSQVVSVDFVD
jgi:hypothetical protein